MGYKETYRVLSHGTDEISAKSIQIKSVLK